ncbi:hypothetical protein F0562_025392 [Nyssa sinensis]|uniref:DUF4283 domain-containing protein n=1 Tax=Nyssa sinensis TaxID=561372 RepID=A0A5J5BFE6_9ASTE|nr:hypothetical protein F0562_025392 [Nyssa sinensis]
MGLAKPRREKLKRSSFAKVARVSQWPLTPLMVEKGDYGMWEDVRIDPKSCEDRFEFLQRFLVKRFGSLDSVVPDIQHVMQWVSHYWKAPMGVRVMDMHGVWFLFELPLKAEATKVLGREWQFEGKRVVLQRWKWDGCGDKAMESCRVLAMGSWDGEGARKFNAPRACGDGGRWKGLEGTGSRVQRDFFPDTRYGLNFKPLMWRSRGDTRRMGQQELVGSNVIRPGNGRGGRGGRVLQQRFGGPRRNGGGSSRAKGGLKQVDGPDLKRGLNREGENPSHQGEVEEVRPTNKRPSSLCTSEGIPGEIRGGQQEVGAILGDSRPEYSGDGGRGTWPYLDEDEEDGSTGGDRGGTTRGRKCGERGRGGDLDGVQGWKINNKKQRSVRRSSPLWIVTSRGRWTRQQQIARAHKVEVWPRKSMSFWSCILHGVGKRRELKGKGTGGEGQHKGGGASDMLPTRNSYPDKTRIRDRRSNWQRNENQQVIVSEWVMRNIRGVGRFPGISCAGYEEDLMDLFADIDKKLREG